MQIETNGILYSKVHINPLDVIEILKKKEIGDGWVFERDGKYYMGYEYGVGCHFIDKEEGISKEKFDMILAIEVIINYFEKRA